MKSFKDIIKSVRGIDIQEKLKSMNSNDIFLVILSLLSLLMTYKHFSKIILLAVIIVSVIGYSFTHNIVHSVAIGMIAVNILVLLNLTDKPTKINVEYFEDASGNVVDSSGNVSELDASGNKINIKKETDKKESEEGDLSINVQESFLEAYKSLTPEQISGLNTDTKELINTQQQLLETLKNMGPALKEGQTILNTFKQYFGSDQDLGGTIETLKSM